MFAAEGEPHHISWISVVSQQFGEEMGAAKLSLSPLKGHEKQETQQQDAGSVGARINNDRASH